MSVLVIGGDNLGNIENNLKEKGFNRITHITGRRSREQTYKVPKDTDVVLILTDYVNHQTSKNVKKQVKNSKSKVIFSKRSWASISKSLKSFIR
ncbi:DUF2325 domain-containing protein [Anaerosalibacter massiliensis]|uniref:DUF2325 domain-containing protein n=1 Tax=Anaerosalibacter massiliensis TaxID=1347392 RepID=A0A9X2S5H0_9FIRM|nr:DUF2325 domain-containing protein [Anaerosalibacter massiliensis]MCR2044309.1 DUF2325 domain-containing protein [Anaerosalibacter massiliensis]